MLCLIQAVLLEEKMIKRTMWQKLKTKPNSAVATTLHSWTSKYRLKYWKYLTSINMSGQT